MRIEVLYFGVLKDFFRVEGEMAELDEGSDVAALYHHLRASASNEFKGWTTLAVAVNREYALASTVLHDGDEVALLPPVSGGCSTIAPEQITESSWVHAS